jgi:pterin-4a-carbinolamine dehydratase
MSAELPAALSQLTKWTRVGQNLERRLRFKDFNQAFGFMTR